MRNALERKAEEFALIRIRAKDRRNRVVCAHLLQADAQRLPFADDTFEVVTVAFGLRNVSDTDRGLGAMTRVARPGGVVVFQMPTVIYFLAKMRMVSAKFLLRHFKYAFLIIFIVAAVITPTGDMITQTIYAAPMVCLYLLSILIAWIVLPRQEP